LAGEDTLLKEPEANLSSFSQPRACVINAEHPKTGTDSAHKNNQNLSTRVSEERPNGTPETNERSPGDLNACQSNEQDIEIDAPLSRDLSIDAVPATPAPLPEFVTEKHDALILYAEEDASLARQLQRDLATNVSIPDLNVILYDEFAPDVQSHFKTMAVLFKRCRYLLVLVTNNFTEASFSRYQNEIALKDSIENKSRSERVVPVWGVCGAQNFVSELSILKGIDYTKETLDADSASVYNIFKNLFSYGRKKIDMS
jgi:hypothetical protein